MKKTLFHNNNDCSVISSDILLEFMQKQLMDESLMIGMSKDKQGVVIYSPADDKEYDEDNILNIVNKKFGFGFNKIFTYGPRYYFNVCFAKVPVLKDQKI